MSNQTYNDFLAKAANPRVLEVVSDSDLIGLHKLCKANQNETNNLLKSRSHQWLPLIEGEIVFRKEVILKAEEDELRKSQDPDEEEEGGKKDDDDDDENLEKGGPGSGRKLGTTRSGKDIYNSFSHPKHKDFTKEDHIDAGDLHSEIEGELLEKDVKRNPTGDPSNKTLHHSSNKDKHWDASGAEEGEIEQNKFTRQT